MVTIIDKPEEEEKKKKKKKEKLTGDALSNEQAKQQGQKYYAGGEELSRTEFNQLRGGGGGFPSQKLSQLKGRDPSLFTPRGQEIGQGRFPISEQEFRKGQEEQISQTSDIIGATDLLSRIEEKILNEPNVQGELTGKDLLGKLDEAKRISGVGIPLTEEQFKAQAATSAIKAGVLGAVGLGALGGLFAGASEIATVKIATQATATATTNTIVGSLKAALGGAILYGIGGNPTDLKRGKIDTARGLITEIASHGDTLRGMVEGGYDIPTAVNQIRKYEESLEEAEAKIKEASIYNVKFRVDGESQEIQKEVADARENLADALRQIINKAATGQPDIDPELLVYRTSQLVNEKK